MARMLDAEIIEQLTTIRGVGQWTVEMLLIFKLGRLDVLPAGDYGVRKGFSVTYHRKDLPKPAELLEHGERWRLSVDCLLVCGVPSNWIDRTEPTKILV
jgi:3-methyladenine DNA glycosylase/8-oxoguanine DNA glycosylase